MSMLGGGGGDRTLKMSLADTFRLAWADPDLRARLIFVLAMFGVFVLGSHIPVPIPGVSTAAFEDAISKSQFFQMLNAFGGGSLKRISIFALGLGPYITASIIVQVLTAANPAWKKDLQEGGEYARKQQNVRTRYLTLILCVFQGLTIWTQIAATGAIPATSQVLMIKATTLLFWTAGSMFMLWLGDQLTQKGIGNGVSLLIFAGIVIGFPNQAGIIAQGVSSGNVSIFQVIIFLILFVATVWFVTMFTLAQRRIGIQHMRRQFGTKSVGGGGNYLPLSVNLVGVIPIIFASAIIYMPGQFMNAFPVGSTGHNILESIANVIQPDFTRWTGIIGAFAYMLLIFFFTYFYTAIQYNVDDIADNLKRGGSIIPGVRPGKQTRDFLDGVISRITMVGAFFLAFVSLSQYVIPLVIPIRSLGAFFGTSLLIMVSVALETMRQIEANLMMKQFQN